MKNYRILKLVPRKEITIEFETIDAAISFIIGATLQSDEYDLQEFTGWQTCKFGEQELRIQDVIGK